ncbi:efflux RND transporter permease subunit [Phycisphaeraceae bacterium D3-23]
MKSLAKLLVDRLWVPIIVLAVVTTAALYGLTQLRLNDDFNAVFDSGSEEQQHLREAQAAFDLGEDQFLVLVEHDDVLSPEGVSALRSLHAELALIDGVDEVVSVEQLTRVPRSPLEMGRPLLPPQGASRADFAAARVQVLDHPLGGGVLVSADGKAALLAVRPQEGLSNVQDLMPIDKAIGIRLSALNAQGTMSASRTGTPAIRCAIARIEGRELALYMLSGMVLGTLVALVLFRRLASLVFVLPVPLLAAVWSLGLMGLFGIEIDLLGIVIPALVMSIALTDVVHLVYAVREQLDDGHAEREATRRGLELVGGACLLASVTSAIAFASLVFSRSPALGRFGLICAGATLLVFVVVVCWVPVAARTGAARRLVRKVDPDSTTQQDSRRWAFLRAVLARPAWVGVGGVILLLACVALSAQLRPDFHYSEHLPETGKAGESVRTLHRIDTSFGGSAPLVVMVGWPEGMSADDPRLAQAIDQTEDALARWGAPATAVSPLTLGRAAGAPPGTGYAADQLRRAVHLVPEHERARLLNTSRRRAIVRIAVPDQGSRRLNPRLDGLDQQLDALRKEYPELTFRLTGVSAVHPRMSQTMIGDALQSLAVAAGGIFLVVGLMLRSARLAARSILPNVLPLAGASAMLLIVGHPFRYNVVLGLTVGLGLAIDDSIQMLYRYQHERRQGLGHADAVHRSARRVGKALITTTLVLSAGLGVLLFSQLPMARLFAQMLIAVLAFALVADLVLLPALLMWGHQDEAQT